MHEKRSSFKKSGRNQRVCLACHLYVPLNNGVIFKRKFINIFRETFTHTVLIESISVESVMEMFKDILVEMAIILLPIMAIAMIAAVAANFFNSVCFSQLKR